MPELDRKVFGKITTKEIIGAQPPAIPETKNLLEGEFRDLVRSLENQSQKNLEVLLDQQKSAQELVNSRPGAMALAQNKIQLFNEYNNKYIQKIEEKLNS